MIEIKEWTIKDPLNCIGYNAGVCWGADVKEKEKNIKRAMQCIKSKHERVEELPDIYCVIYGYSAKCLRELYTHIGGMPTRLQASTRYIDYSNENNFSIITPPSIKSDNERLSIWNEALNSIQTSMIALKQLGVPNEDYTMLLPLAYESKMIWKINLRALINFMNMRLCTRAYWEIRNLCKELSEKLKKYSEEWKIICEKLFIPKCKALGYCTEKKSCGMVTRKR